MSQSPFMPLWVSDFIGDTQDLDAVEVGAYLMLLMSMWLKGGSLPDDEGKLKRVARCGREWPRVWSSIKPYFTISEGQIQNKRLSEELAKVNMKREVNSRNGARGGRAKALKDNKPPIANATNSLKQPEPYSEIEKRTPDGVPKKTTPRTELLAVLDDEHAEAVIEHRQRIRKPLTPRAGKLLAGKFAQCPDPNAAADAMVANGWQGFEPEWLERIRSTGPPNQGPTYSDIRREAERKLAELESRPNDHRPDPVLRLVAQ